MTAAGEVRVAVARRVVRAVLGLGFAVRVAVRLAVRVGETVAVGAAGRALRVAGVGVGVVEDDVVAGDDGTGRVATDSSGAPPHAASSATAPTATAGASERLMRRRSAGSRGAARGRPS
ncbi:hypothetical protein [Angustibacter sp. Root456]|uniref:hypothetical protein n=1 Tax=Angustibacter sp. Root456 TaxID=1736539 RepID=UPI0012FA50D5|nr:hypothetical protein [Angustibacter sp. Root456]